MPERFLVEFLSQWIQDEDLRARVLHKEVTGLTEWGADQYQRNDLRELNKDKIIERLVEELEDDLGIDLASIIADWTSTGGSDGEGGTTGSAYDEGGTHVRGVDPAAITTGLESLVVARGHGWTDDVTFAFVPEALEEDGAATDKVPAERLDFSCDVDVWQRATLKVTLPAKGTWRVEATVSENEDPVSTEPVLVKAV